jgi:hypothetical protein
MQERFWLWIIGILLILAAANTLAIPFQPLFVDWNKVSKNQPNAIHSDSNDEERRPTNQPQRKRNEVPTHCDDELPEQRESMPHNGVSIAIYALTVAFMPASVLFSDQATLEWLPVRRRRSVGQAILSARRR